MKKISIRLDDAEVKRIDRVCKAIKKSTPQNPSMSAILKRWLFLQMEQAEKTYGIEKKARPSQPVVALSDLPITHQKILVAVKELIEESKGLSPTFDEIGVRIGATQSWAQRVCVDLKKRGLLDWDDGKHRDVRVVGEWV